METTVKQVWRSIMVCVGLAAVSPVQAEIYRCAGPAGEVLFTDVACATGFVAQLTLQENSPLDSTAARMNQARYRARQDNPPPPNAFLIPDSDTARWNEQLEAEERAAAKKKGRKKKKKSKSGASGKKARKKQRSP